MCYSSKSDFDDISIPKESDWKEEDNNLTSFYFIHYLFYCLKETKT